MRLDGSYAVERSIMLEREGCNVEFGTWNVECDCSVTRRDALVEEGP